MLLFNRQQQSSTSPHQCNVPDVMNRLYGNLKMGTPMQESYDQNAFPTLPIK